MGIVQVTIHCARYDGVAEEIATFRERPWSYTGKRKRADASNQMIPAIGHI